MNNILQAIDTSKLLTIIGIIALLAIVFAVLIVLVSKACAVKVDEKAEQIKDHLAGANCGGCGYAGCADFAKALSEGKANISQCGPTSKEGKAEISKILGLCFVGSVESFAVVHCAGGENAFDRFKYVGEKGCEALSSTMGGQKACSFACLGGGSCENVCPSNAIEIKNGVSFSYKEKCSACGLCTKACPKKIIELIPKTAKVYVACSSQCRAKEVMNACTVGCIGCGLCAKTCPENAIIMENNLPIIDYSKCSGCLTCVSKCSRKTIKQI